MNRTENKLAMTLEMIKFEHTVFALPFALIGALLAERGIPPAKQLLWIVVAMVGARSAAMAFNRIVDVRFDRENPRTRSRALAAGTLSIPFAAGLTIASSALFILAAAQLNRVCLALSVPALAVVFGYSYTKRFTAWSHLFLGLAIGIAPAAAWLAIREELSAEPIFLTAAVLFWVGGFDIIYALQDMDFDRRARLFSIPARWGVAAALWISGACHAATVALLVAAAYWAGLGGIAYAGIGIVTGILIWEHWIVRPSDLSRINVAFFNLNGYVSILLLVAFAADILVRS